MFFSSLPKGCPCLSTLQRLHVNMMSLPSLSVLSPTPRLTFLSESSTLVLLTEDCCCHVVCISRFCARWGINPADVPAGILWQAICSLIAPDQLLSFLPAFTPFFSKLQSRPVFRRCLLQPPAAPLTCLKLHPVIIIFPSLLLINCWLKDVRAREQEQFSGTCQKDALSPFKSIVWLKAQLLF